MGEGKQCKQPFKTEGQGREKTDRKSSGKGERGGKECEEEGRHLFLGGGGWLFVLQGRRLFTHTEEEGGKKGRRGREIVEGVDLM